MWSRLLAFVLVLALWPAVGETVELGVHLAQHGDLAHEGDAEHEDSPLGADEHGCSGTFHLCPCHAPAQLTVPRATELTKTSTAVAAQRTPPPVDSLGCGPAAPPIRPPIA